jgi:hypothetical protein
MFINTLTGSEEEQVGPIHLTKGEAHGPVANDDVISNLDMRVAVALMESTSPTLTFAILLSLYRESVCVCVFV